MSALRSSNLHALRCFGQLLQVAVMMYWNSTLRCLRFLLSKCRWFWFRLVGLFVPRRVVSRRRTSLSIQTVPGLICLRVQTPRPDERAHRPQRPKCQACHLRLGGPRVGQVDQSRNVPKNWISAHSPLASHSSNDSTSRTSFNSNCNSVDGKT